MPGLAGVAGLVLVIAILWDAFETVVLPRRVARRVRVARAFYKLTWPPFAALARRIDHAARRETFLSFFGPLSLILLIVVWAVSLVLGFALLQYGAGSAWSAPEGQPDFSTDLYASGTTFFTLGLGDVVPRSTFARLVVVAEVGTGFAFLALVISYLPILYQSFSAREKTVSLLDGRAGTPPNASELVRRNVCDGHLELLEDLLRDWERWSADLLETHLSYPVLAYYRSQHEKQSWVGALTVVLDACALVMTVGSAPQARQAQFTYAIARHAAGDLSQVFGTRPRAPVVDRLSSAEAARVWETLARSGLPLPSDGRSERYLASLREGYEPYVAALADYLFIDLPRWLPEPDAHDDWEVTAWGVLPHIELPGSGDDGVAGTVQAEQT
jgi:Ion channel